MDVVLPLLAALVLLVFWNYGIEIFSVPEYLVPKPGSVARALHQGLIGGTLWPHIGATFLAVSVGYVIGCSAGFLVASLLSESRTAERALFPIFIGFQSIPKVAVAPLLIVWFGFGIESKIVIVVLISFFPCFVNSLSGLKSYDRNLADLYRAFGAGKMDIFLSVKVPAALGQIFAGLQIAVVLAILGAVVSELISSRRGLGHVIQASALNFDVATMFACIIVLAVMGVAATQTVKFVQRRAVFWERADDPSAT